MSPGTIGWGAPESASSVGRVNETQLQTEPFSSGWRHGEFEPGRPVSHLVTRRRRSDPHVTAKKGGKNGISKVKLEEWGHRWLGARAPGVRVHEHFRKHGFEVLEATNQAIAIVGKTEARALK